MVETVDAGEFDSHDEWRGTSAGGSLVGKGELFAVVWYEHAHQKCREAVEEENLVEGELDGARNSLAWVLCFSYSHSNKLSSKICEDRGAQSGPEAEKSSCRPTVDVLCECSGVFPVAEAFAITIWATS